MGGSSPASHRWGCSEQWVAALLPATGGAAQSNGWQLSCQLQVGLLRVLWCGGFDTAMATTAVSLSSSTALTPHPSPVHLPLTPLQCCFPFLPLPALVVPQALLAGKVLLGLARYMLCHFGLNHHSKEGVLCVCRFVWGCMHVCTHVQVCVCVYV